MYRKTVAKIKRENVRKRNENDKSCKAVHSFLPSFCPPHLVSLCCPLLFERVLRQVKSIFCKYFRLFKSLRSHLIEIAKDHFKCRLTKPLNFHFVRMQSLIQRFLYDEFLLSVLVFFLFFYTSLFSLFLDIFILLTHASARVLFLIFHSFKILEQNLKGSKM